MLNILHHHLNWIEALADLDQEAANAVFYNGLGGKDDNGKTERLGWVSRLNIRKLTTGGTVAFPFAGLVYYSVGSPSFSSKSNVVPRRSMINAIWMERFYIRILKATTNTVTINDVTGKFNQLIIHRLTPLGLPESRSDDRNRWSRNVSADRHASNYRGSYNKIRPNERD